MKLYSFLVLVSQLSIIITASFLEADTIKRRETLSTVQSKNIATSQAFHKQQRTLSTKYFARQRTSQAQPMLVKRNTPNTAVSSNTAVASATTEKEDKKNDNRFTWKPKHKSYVVASYVGLIGSVRLAFGAVQLQISSIKNGKLTSFASTATLTSIISDPCQIKTMAGVPGKYIQSASMACAGNGANPTISDTAVVAATTAV